MIKSIAVMSIVASVAIAASFYEPNDKSFKNGFYAGLKALEFQAKNDGFSPKNIEITKPYLLVSHIKDSSLNDALFLQLIANREGFESHLTLDFVSFGEFDRKADAKTVATMLEENFKIKTQILENQKTIVTHPYLFKDFYATLLNEAKQKGIIVETKIVEMPKKFVAPKQPIKKVEQPSAQIFNLKNEKAMSYSLSGNDSSNSQNYKENQLKSGAEFILDKKVTTKQGEVFYKVKNQNIYFSNKDIVIK